MKHYSVLSALVAGLSINNVHAQEFKSYDRKIEAAAVKRAGEKIGTLRGIILADEKNLFVLPSHLAPTPDVKLKFSLPKQTHRAPKISRQNSLPPIVMNQAVDPVVTGQSFPRSTAFLKFDADGQPLKHHQEYPRPTLKSVAKSLLEAMEMNAFPGAD